MNSSSHIIPIAGERSIPFGKSNAARTTKFQCRQLQRLFTVLNFPVLPQLAWKSAGTAIVIVGSRYTISDFANMQAFLHGLVDIDGFLGPEDTHDYVVMLLNTFAD